MRARKQASESDPPGINLRRRFLGVVICFAPVALLLTSLVVALAQRSTKTAGLVFALVALAFGILNLYLSFVRPWLYRNRKGSLEGYRNISGLPMFGTILAVAAGLEGFGQIPAAVVGLIAVLLDSGGLPWFLIATWRDESFWDE